MFRNIKIVFWFLVVAIIATRSFVFGELENSNLLENSPFIPYDYVSRGGYAGGSKRGAVEFRGILQFDDEEKFSLYNSLTQKSVWVNFRDRTAPYFVESYDPTKKTIIVGINGIRDTLSLSKASSTPLDINPASKSFEPSAKLSESSNAPGAPSEGKEMDPEKRKEMADKVFDSFRKYVAERRRAQEEALE